MRFDHFLLRVCLKSPLVDAKRACIGVFFWRGSGVFLEIVMMYGYAPFANERAMRLRRYAWRTAMSISIVGTL